MPNPYFQLKEFIIYQDKCAMKVCTDACLLGAWFAKKTPLGPAILDIGCGSGLLMLMLAQKNGGEIQGIELDQPSFKQLRENISISKWSDRLQAFYGDARHHLFPGKYDFIISNPPFYEDDLLSPSFKKNIAKHSLALDLEDLLKIIQANLKPTGSFGILLPYHRASYFEKIALEYPFYVTEKLSVRQSPRHAYFRTIMHFSGQPQTHIAESELTIQNEGAEFTTEFADLLKDYYLNL